VLFVILLCRSFSSYQWEPKAATKKILLDTKVPGRFLAVLGILSALRGALFYYWRRLDSDDRAASFYAALCALRKRSLFYLSLRSFSLLCSVLRCVWRSIIYAVRKLNSVPVHIPRHKSCKIYIFRYRNINHIQVDEALS